MWMSLTIYTIIALLGPIPEACSESRLAELYSDLKAVRVRTASVGTNPEISHEISRIRKSFLADERCAAPFLVDVLSRLDREDQERGQEATLAALMSHPKQYHAKLQLKFDISVLLSEMYAPQLPAVQRRILDVLARGYTPVTWFRSEATVMSWIMLNLGRDAVPILLIIAQHDHDMVRCGVQDVLEVVAEVDPEAPVLDCTLPRNEQYERLLAWVAWWATAGIKEKFPQGPDFEKLTIAPEGA